MITDADSKFHSEGGKKPARLLFCEYFDNSIEALRRKQMADRTEPAYPMEIPPIELHLIYEK